METKLKAVNSKLNNAEDQTSDLLEEAQAGIKIAGKNINNLRYTDDTTLMAESAQSQTRLK